MTHTEGKQENDSFLCRFLETKTLAVVELCIWERKKVKSSFVSKTANITGRGMRKGNLVYSVTKHS